MDQNGTKYEKKNIKISGAGARKSRAQNSKVPSAKWQAKMGNWHAKKYLDGQIKEKMVSQNIPGLPKQILMATPIFFLILCPGMGGVTLYILWWV